MRRFILTCSLVIVMPALAVAQIANEPDPLDPPSDTLESPNDTFETSNDNLAPPPPSLAEFQRLLDRQRIGERQLDPNNHRALDNTRLKGGDARLVRRSILDLAEPVGGSRGQVR
jgi:hypothetical protein